MINLLKDVKIVAFTQMLLGPAAGQYLADMGADIIKIEPRGAGTIERGWAGGETILNGESAFFMLANRNLRSVSLDLKSPQGRKIALELIDEADVVIENYRPGVLDRLGLGWDEVSKRRPTIVYASASGYGKSGPYANLPGQDLLLQAMSGLAGMTGTDSNPPTPAGAAVVDQHAGTLLALGITAALFRRERTGKGERVELTMFEAALDLQQEGIVYHANGGKVARPRTPIASSFHEAPYGIYRTLDGAIAISLRPVELVSAALGDPDELADVLDPAIAWDQRDDIYERIAGLISGLNSDEVIETLRNAGVWSTRVNDYDALVRDPVFEYVAPLVEIDHPVAGPVKLLKHPIHFGSDDFEVTKLPPALGAHSADVLQKLGYTKSEIDKLAESGVIQVSAD